MIGFLLKLITRPVIAFFLAILAPLMAQISPIVGFFMGFLSFALALWLIADAIEKLSHIFL